MSEQIVEKIIGGWYVAHNDDFFAADIYEGNYYKIQEGNVIKTLPLASDQYDIVLAQYKECVEKNQRISTAYDMNQRAHLKFAVPAVTADPEAADKEWFIRTHPQVVHKVEQPKKKRGLLGFFKREKKESISIKCLRCGTVNDDKQKFCGECGAKLLGADEEFMEQADTMESPKEMDKTAVDPVLENTEKKKQDEQSNKSEDIRKVPKNSKKSKALIEEPEIMIIDENEVAPMPEADAKEEAEVQRIEKAREDKAVRTIGTDKEKRPERVSEADSKKEETSADAEKKEAGKAPKKKKSVGILYVALAVVLLVAAAIPLVLYMTQPGNDVVYDSEANHVVIKLKNDIAMNQQITEEDIEGTILGGEQYEKYNSVSTYIDKDGNKKEKTLLLWEDKDDVVGKYATSDLPVGTILYDTSVTTEHVVADKTFVDVEVDGEGNTYEVATEVLPGNTRIQIVAIIQTDNAQPQQVLLSEMTLQDRSLQSIFDSAGQDILKMLSEQNDTADMQTNETADEQPQENEAQSADEATGEEVEDGE